MKIKDLELLVGDRGLDDIKTKKIPGRLIMPDKKSNTLLLVSAGWTTKYSSYSKHFGELLGEEFNVYITEQRKGRFRKASVLKTDFSQIDEQIRDRVEPDNVIYVGHSLGTAIANSCIEDFGKEVAGLYGVCAYHQYSNSRSIPLMRVIANYVEKSKRGFLVPLLKGSQFTVPTKLAIAGGDHTLRTHRLEIQQKFLDIFEQHGAEVEVFDNMNHGFNMEFSDLNGFNKNEPELLVKSVRDFVYKVLD